MFICRYIYDYWVFIAWRSLCLFIWCHCRLYEFDSLSRTLGLAPAVLVTIFNEPVKAALCCLVVLVVQQLDGNIIYPNVIGKSLKIHPLTIILILLVAGNLAGLLGIFLGVPFYAICRTIIYYVIDMVKAGRSEKVTNAVLLGNETNTKENNG